MSEASKRKEKPKWAIEKLKLDNARKLSGIYFIDPGDGEFKDIMKKRVKSWKIRGYPQRLAKFNEISTGGLVALKRSARQNTPALSRPINLRGSAWKDLFTSITKIILQKRNGFIESLVS